MQVSREEGENIVMAGRTSVRSALRWLRKFCDILSMVAVAAEANIALARYPTVAKRPASFLPSQFMGFSGLALISSGRKSLGHM